MALVDLDIIGSKRRASVAQMRAYGRKVNLAHVASKRAQGITVAPLTEAELSAIVGAFVQIGDLYGIAGDAAFAQSLHETAGYTFGGQVSAWQHNPAGLGATNDGASGGGWPTWQSGINAMFIHLLAWCNDRRGDGDYRIAAVRQEAAKKGWSTSWRSLGGRWAVPGLTYGDAIEKGWQAMAKEGIQTMNPQQRTDAMIAALRAAGCEVIDVRGKLPVNPNPANRYGPVRGGLGGVTKVVQHWTGDSFNRATVKQVTGTDYGVDRISEAMGVDDEIDMLRWYANYHISKDGGSWGGIAYGTLFFPSGRVYVAWNIGTLTYHAFSVNGYSYALCCPNANGQALTPRQLAAMNRTWLYLFEETPEIPAAWADLWAHAEAKRFDVQNQTSCPGPEILRHVQQARSSGKPTVSLASNAAGTIADGLGKTPTAPDGEAANPSALRLDVPGLGERWIIEPILSTWREAGGVFGNPNAPGYPRSGMYAEGDTMIQWFERARIEVKGETVSFGLVGLEAAQAAGKAA